MVGFPFPKQEQRGSGGRLSGPTFCFWSHLSDGVLGFRLPRWLNGKESACQCRRRGCDSWITKIPWRRKWLPTPVFLPGKSHGQRSLVHHSPWGQKESDMTWRLNSNNNNSRIQWPSVPPMSYKQNWKFCTSEVGEDRQLKQGYEVRGG